MERTASRRGLSVGWFTAVVVALAGASTGCLGRGGGAGAPAGGPVGVTDPPPAPPPPAPGGAGWLVAGLRTPGQEAVEVHAAGAPAGEPVQRIDGGAVLGVVEGAGALYGRGRDARGWAELGLLRPGDARRIVLAAEPGHRYAFLADATGPSPFLAGGRLLVADAACAGAVTLRSFALDGSDPRELTAGACAAVSGAALRPEGVAFRCEPSGLRFSDGASPAVPLAGVGAGARALGIATAGGRAWVVLEDASRVVAAPGDGSGAAARLSPELAGTDALVALAGSTALVTTAVGPADHATWTVSVDGALRSPRRRGASAPTGAGTPAVTPDGRFLAVLGGDATGPARAVLIPADPEDGAVVDLPASAATPALAVTRFTTGDFLVKLQGTGYVAVTAAGAAGPLLDAFTSDRHVVDAGRWAVFQSPDAPHPMKAVPLDRTEYFALTAAGSTATTPLVSASGTILFLDAAGFTWAAAPELGQRLSVDAAPADGLRLTGTLGARELVAVHHVAGEDVTYAVDAATGSVEVVLRGAVGWFLP